MYLGQRSWSRNSVVAFFATTAADGKTYQVEYYNLDAILSVGYRVNSKRGTQFRIWATRVLREHMIRGYSINERRLKELNQAIRLIADVAERRTLTGEEATSLLRVVADYSFALDLLDAYDRQAVGPAGGSRRPVKGISLEEARKTVERLREHYRSGTLFGQERDKSLAGSLQAVFQTFGGKDLYPTLEEKAAHLLYFLVKNHPFVDGNKRIAATLVLMVSGEERRPLPIRRRKENRRQRPGSHDTTDRRKPPAGKGPPHPSPRAPHSSGEAMSTKWPKVKLGEVMRQRKEFVIMK